MKIFGIQINFFRSKSDKLKEEFREKMAAGDLAGAAKIITSNRKTDFSPLVKKFSLVIDEAVEKENIEMTDFMTFVDANSDDNSLKITPKMIAYAAANAQNQFHLITPFELATRQLKSELKLKLKLKSKSALDLELELKAKLDELINATGPGGTTLLELVAKWNKDDRKMVTKINLTTYLAGKGAKMTPDDLDNILEETEKDKPSDSRENGGWTLEELSEVFKSLTKSHSPEELEALLTHCRPSLKEKFGYAASMVEIEETLFPTRNQKESVAVANARAQGFGFSASTSREESRS